MSTSDGALTVVYNGEIYNFAALRRELEALGHRFVSSGDTEVLLHGYRQWGLEELLERVRGMFAFALHDRDRGETLLARDPLGIKPLYTAQAGERLVVASEIQAIRKIAPDGGLDPEALASYLLWGSIAAPRTLYLGIRALPAGHWLRVREGRAAEPVAYFRLEDELGRSEPMSPHEPPGGLRIPA
jgi:asparagine synthase (glutamine-hydrolysing)